MMLAFIHSFIQQVLDAMPSPQREELDTTNKIIHGSCQVVIQTSKGKQTTNKEFKPYEEQKVS